MRKGAKNRTMARRTACEKDAEKWTDSVGPSLLAFFHSLFPIRAFPHYLNAWNRLVSGQLLCLVPRVSASGRFDCISNKQLPTTICVDEKVVVVRGAVS